MCLKRKPGPSWRGRLPGNEKCIIPKLATANRIVQYLVCLIPHKVPAIMFQEGALPRYFHQDLRIGVSS